MKKHSEPCLPNVLQIVRVQRLAATPQPAATTTTTSKYYTVNNKTFFKSLPLKTSLKPSPDGLGRCAGGRGRLLGGAPHGRGGDGLDRTAPGSGRADGACEGRAGRVHLQLDTTLLQIRRLSGTTFSHICLEICKKDRGCGKSLHRGKYCKVHCKHRAVVLLHKFSFLYFGGLKYSIRHQK
jgi:hypothetical protein